MANVLIVDDHRPTALALRKLLDLAGHCGNCAEWI